MDTLKRKRKALRASFTRTLNAIKDQLGKGASDIDVGFINDKLVKLNQLICDIKIVDNDILNKLVEVDNIADEVIDIEIEDSEKYTDEHIEISRRVKETTQALIHQNNDSRVNGESVEVVEVAGSQKNKHYKLPKLNIPIYDGTLLNYLSFWSQFKKIHEDRDLEDCDKFQYLLQSVQSGTRAKELLSSYPLTSENYTKAVEAFQGRFGKKELQIEVYVRELLKLIISNVRANNKERLPLPDLYIKIEAYLRSLESMGLDANMNATWLFPMVESSLPEETLKAWQRYPTFTSEMEEGKSRLSNLLGFLKMEVEGEERLSLARRGFDSSRVKSQGGVAEHESKCYKGPSTPTVAGLHTFKETKCAFCEKAHDTRECLAARSMTYEEKLDKLKQKRCCLKCFKFFHHAKECRNFVRCILCDKAHHIQLCPDLPVKGKTNQAKERNPAIVQNTVASPTCTKEIALMILEVDIVGSTVKRKVRALLDSASQKSYILKSTAKELGLKSISSEKIAHSLFGGVKTATKNYNKYSVKLCPRGRNVEKSYEFEFLEQDMICGNIPRLPKGPWLKELKRHKIWISDIGPDCPKIDMLIGSDIYGKLLTGKIRQLDNGLTAVQTKLGWTVCGQLENNTSPDCSMSCSIIAANVALHDFKVADLWRLESIGIMDPGETLTKSVEEEMAQEQFLNSLSKNEDSRYSVGLPWINDKENIPSNRNIAERRLFNATRRLKMLNRYDDYNRVLHEWVEEGVIEPVPEDELKETGHYLPHHPVFKPDSKTTKIRPVFDASCKDGRSPSLNECLVTGPNLIELIPAILLRFREKSIGVVSDIRRAFLQIEIEQQDRKYLRFLWWKDKNTVQEFQHNRVVFGVRCSPFLLGAVIRYHLENASEDSKDLANRLAKSFYIDNCVTSVEDCHELEQLIVGSSKLLAEAKMELRLWQFGPEIEIKPEFISDKELLGDLVSPIPVLGLNWDRTDDTLFGFNKCELKSTKPTKREILSLTQSIFDPIGFLAPVLLPAKLFIPEA